LAAARKKRKVGRKSDRLTPKQRRFVDAYCGEARFNATKAALIARYSPKSAASIGQENLKKPLIKKAIEARLLELAEESKIHFHEVAQSVRRVIGFDHRKIFGPGWKIGAIESLDDDTALALNRVKVVETVLQKNDDTGETLVKRTVEVAIPDRLKADELAAKMGGFLSPVDKGDESDGVMNEFLEEIRKRRNERQA